SVGGTAPQLLQNLLVGEISVPHSGQRNVSSVPQPPQNLAPFRFSNPHTEHRILHLPYPANRWGLFRLPTHRKAGVRRRSSCRRSSSAVDRCCTCSTTSILVRR